jgi:glucose/arabinose dehydrogenase
MPRRRVIAVLFAAAGAAMWLVAAGCNDEPARPAERASTLPLWRQPPDKPPGPALPRERGAARSFALRRVVGGLRAPVALVARPGDRTRLFVAEQAGRVRVVERGRLRARPYLDIRRQVRSGGEQGLLTLAFNPRGDRLYAMFTNRAGDTRVVRYAAGRATAVRSSARTLLALDQPFANHNGGTLVFDDRGRLVLGLGDGGGAFGPRERAQSARSRLGKLLRFDPARPEAGWRIVATGLRNPWRMAFDRATGMLWLGDVGQDRVEEIDALWLPEEGQRLPNLGWAAYEGNLPLGRKPLGDGVLVWPVAGYRHEGGHCSVAGGTVYRGRRIAAMRGRYVFGDFCRGTLWTLDARAAEDPEAVDLRREAARLPGLTSFGEGPDGELYALSAQGTIAQLRPSRSDIH